MEQKVTKSRTFWYAQYDYKSIEKKLEKMAGQGWVLDSIGMMQWNFRKEEPQERRYEIVFMKSASEFNPLLTEGQQMLNRFAAADGWEYVGEQRKMQVFTTTDMDAEPLVTDERARLKSIHGAMMTRQLPLFGVLLAVMLFRTWSEAQRLLGNGEVLWEQGIFVAYVFCALGSGWMLADYFIWYLRCRLSIARGGGCVSNPFYLPIFAVILAGALGAYGWYSSGISGGLGTGILTLLAIGAAYYIGGVLVPEHLKEKGASAAENQIKSVGCTVALSLLAIIGVTLFILMWDIFGNLAV